MASRRLDDEIARIDANRNYYPPAATVASAQPFTTTKKTFAPVSAPRSKNDCSNAMYRDNQQSGLPTYVPANYGSSYSPISASSLLRNPKDPLPSPPVPLQTGDKQAPTGKPSYAYSQSVGGADMPRDSPRGGDDGQHVHHFTAETITKQFPTHMNADTQNPPHAIYQKEVRVESYTKSPYPIIVGGAGQECGPNPPPPPPPPPPAGPRSPISPGVIYDVPSNLISASTISRNPEPPAGPLHGGSQYSEFQARHSPGGSPSLPRAPQPVDECIYAAPNTPIYACPDERAFNTLPVRRVGTPPNHQQPYKNPPPAVAPKPYYTLEHQKSASRQSPIARPAPQQHVQRVSPPNMTSHPLYTATDAGYNSQVPTQAQQVFAQPQQQPAQPIPATFQTKPPQSDDYYRQSFQRRSPPESAYHHREGSPVHPPAVHPPPLHQLRQDDYVRQPQTHQAYVSERPAGNLRSYPMPNPNDQVSENDVDNLTRLLMQSMDNAGEPDFFGMCAKCGSRVLGENAGCSAMNHIYHLECFICTKCGKQLSGNPFFAVEGRPFCEPDYLDTLEKCSVCDRPITDRILRATGKPYHPQCFQCVVCGKGLDGIPFTVDASNQIHCIEDFHKKFAPRCHMCKMPIMPNPGEEQTVRIVAMDKSFHIECYKCEDCGLLLSSEADGRGCYPLDDHILCRACNTCHVQNITTNL